jgi:haloacetate dehalogenase
VFEGFTQIKVQTSDRDVEINARYGGVGPPILLLHGNPLTHVHWHLVAPVLAKNFTVVATDLRGYGDSSKPQGLADHSNYSFRRMAQDQIEVMSYLGFTNFYLAGHDRGARVAHRMALDHEERVRKVVFFDILPTHYMLANMSWRAAYSLFHWFFMAQPRDIPENLIQGREDFYIFKKLNDMGIGKGGFSEETISEYKRCCSPENIHAVCEDYRAQMTIDIEMDNIDFERGNKIKCPVAALWGSKSHIEKFFNPQDAWQDYCENIDISEALDCGHYPAEQAPLEVTEKLSYFFSS